MTYVGAWPAMLHCSALTYDCQAHTWADLENHPVHVVLSIVTDQATYGLAWLSPSGLRPMQTAKRPRDSSYIFLTDAPCLSNSSIMCLWNARGSEPYLHQKTLRPTCSHCSRVGFGR